MFAALAKMLAAPIVERMFAVIERHQSKAINRERLEADVRLAVIEALSGLSEHQASVIVAEARGESWLQRNWRPVIAVSFGFIVLFYALLLPVAVDWFGLPPVRVGDKLLEWIMNAVVVCLGGYIAGRSIEKVARRFGKF